MSWNHFFGQESGIERNETKQIFDQRGNQKNRQLGFQSLEKMHWTTQICPQICRTSGRRWLPLWMKWSGQRTMQIFLKWLDGDALFLIRSEQNLQDLFSDDIFRKMDKMFESPMEKSLDNIDLAFSSHVFQSVPTKNNLWYFLERLLWIINDHQVLHPFLRFHLSKTL